MKALAIAAAFALVGIAAAAQENDEPVPSSEQSVNDAASVRPPEPPRVEIKERMEESDAKRLAERISDVLGVEISLPTSPQAKPSRTLSVEAGTWTAKEILDQVAKQIDGTWRLDFELRPEDPKKRPPESKIAPLESITLVARLSLPKAARTIAREVGCTASFSQPSPEYVMVEYRDVPADLALADLASKAGCDLWRRVVFALPVDPEQGAQLQDEEFLSGLMEQTEQKMHLATSLQEMLGIDLDDPNLPWDSVPALISLPDTTPEEMEALVGQLRAESEMTRFMREIEAEQPFSPADGPERTP